MGEEIQSFRDLRVYRLALELQQDVFSITQAFPKHEMYSLTDQMRRSARSVGANLAEAWHKRRYPSHFVSKLTDADGEQAETQHWLITSNHCGYITDATRDDLLLKCQEIGRMLGAMMRAPEKFWRH